MKFGRAAWRRGAGTRDGSSGALPAEALAVAAPRTVDLRVLLLASGGDEPSTHAWGA